MNAQLVVGAGNVTFSNTSASTRTYSVSGNSVITGTGARLTVGSFPGNIMQLTSGGLLVNSGGQLVATAGSRISTPGLLTVVSGTLTAQSGGVIVASLANIGDGGSGSALVTGAGRGIGREADIGLSFIPPRKSAAADPCLQLHFCAHIYTHIHIHRDTRTTAVG